MFLSVFESISLGVSLSIAREESGAGFVFFFLSFIKKGSARRVFPSFLTKLKLLRPLLLLLLLYPIYRPGSLLATSLTSSSASSYQDFLSST